MASFPGWTWEYIDDCMTIPRMQAITKYQLQYPPVHILVAAYMGYKGGERATSPSGTDENGESLFDLFPQSR